MNPIDLELLKNQVLNFDNKDERGLNDFQKLPDQFGIAIPYVGISRYRIPMNFQHEFGVMSHDVEVSMSVHLAEGKTGINMSRLCQILQDEAMNEVVSAKMIQKTLAKIKDQLRDKASEPLLKNATLKLNFKYPIKQKSLKSNNWGWQYYNVSLSATCDHAGEFKFILTTDYEYSSTCPCSLSMTKQYEQDFAKGNSTEGNGMGVAHSQRSRARVTALLSKEGLEKDFFFGDFIKNIKTAIPTETQSLVKRVDEQAFAILNGSNPMFVEHVAKRLFSVLNENAALADWIAQIEHFESLHSHNAAAVISKGLPNGFQKTDLF